MNSYSIALVSIKNVFKDKISKEFLNLNKFPLCSDFLNFALFNFSEFPPIKLGKWVE